MGDKETTINTLEAAASFVIPGLGQLIQKRPYVGLLHFILAAALWITFMFLGWIIHIWSAIDAARYKMIDEEQK